MRVRIDDRLNWQLAELLAAPDKLPEELREVVVGEEGWILGVPAPEPEFWDK